MRKLNIAIVGATGLVGRTMLKILHERNFPHENITLYASDRSEGKIIEYGNNKYVVRPLTDSIFEHNNIALFSAGSEVSLKYAPIAASKGCIVIDNSSAWRMNEDVPLVVPEVNPDALMGHHGIIANPNCSTIQFVVALKPIHDRFNLKRVVVSTYQSVTGAGQKGKNQLFDEIHDIEPKSRITNHTVAYNAFFHGASGTDGDFTIEEIKMFSETRKILNIPDLPLAITCVRLPIIGGHGESVNIELEKEFSIQEIKETLLYQDGIRIIDNLKNDEYPTPALAMDTDFVYIGRIRRDASVKNGLYLWIVSDNVRKGAATNAVQIAELIQKENLFNFS